MNQKERTKIIKKCENERFVVRFVTLGECNDLEYQFKTIEEAQKKLEELISDKRKEMLACMNQDEIIEKVMKNVPEYAKPAILKRVKQALSIAEDDYQNRLARAERMSRQGLMERDKQISELEKKIELLEIDEKTNLDDFEKLQNAHEKLRRQINCIKDHPEIKPLNCCWMADSLELRELRKP